MIFLMIVMEDIGVCRCSWEEGHVSANHAPNNNKGDPVVVAVAVAFFSNLILI